MRNDQTPFLAMMVSVNMCIMSLLLLATDDGVIVEIEQKVVDSSEQVDYSDHPDYKTLKCIPRKDHGDPNTTICDEWEEVPKEEEQY